MTSADRITGVALLALGLAFSAVALRSYAYWDHRGPGPAFLPFYLGIALSVLAVLLIAGVGRPPAPEVPAARTEPARRVRPLVVLAAAAVFVAVMPWVGMILGTGLFVVAILRGLERFGWGLSIGVAVATAAANYLVFTAWLRVPFPVGVLGF